MIQINSENVITVKNFAWSFASDFNRVFDCNAVMFQNSGTGNVIINDVYTLIPGTSIDFEADKNEIDSTSYKVHFVAGFTNNLQTWVKYNNGVSAIIDAKNAAAFNRPIKNRRAMMKEFANRRRPGSDF